jgi:S1/P1 nuclease
MKRKILLVAPALSLILLCSVTSHGWWDTGHMAVAYVAYKNLTPQTRARVDALVQLNPKVNEWLARIPAGTSPEDKKLMLFMIAATWADLIKKDGQHVVDGKLENGEVNGNLPPDDGTAARNIGYSDTAMHQYWHFVDLPFSPDNTPLQQPPKPNAETQIAVFRAVLASNSSDELKSYDLVWLLHLVGDVHQPLHATQRFTHSTRNGDAGGNFVKVKDGADMNLHSFWDSLPGGSTDPQVAITYAQGLSPAPASAANNLNASEWIKQSFKLAKSTVYKNPPIGVGPERFTIIPEYRDAAQALAKKQVALAGARMAKILNNELR